MKPVNAFLLVIIACLSITTSNASTSVLIIPASNSVVKDPNPLSLISAKEFLRLTPERYREITGRKMNLPQRIELKMMQHKVKKLVKKGKVVNMADVQKRFEDLNTMNVLGFLLGLILGPVGVVIALILKETGDVGSDVVRWSLYGLLIWLAIVLVAILI